jgi:histidinol-phosphate aminotransferase
MKISVPDHIQSLKPYVAGKPLEEVEREYGITDAVKLASNENPLGPSPMAVKAVKDGLENMHRYPNGGSYELIGRLASRLKLKRENIVLGNGSDDIIALLAQVLLQAGDEAILPLPSFLFYDIVIRGRGAIPVGVPLKSHSTDLEGMLARVNPKTRLIFVNNPHNPTGSLISRESLESFIAALPADVVLVIDEAYFEFVKDGDCPASIDYLQSDKIVVGLRTFSKAYGLAGLRVGYGLMPSFMADLLNRVRQPFNVNSLALAGAIAALEDEDFLAETVALVHDELAFLYAGLDDLAVEYLKSQANFCLIRVAKNADEVFEGLLKQGVIVRSMSSYGYSDCIRVNVGRHHENVRLLEALEVVLRK